MTRLKRYLSALGLLMGALFCIAFIQRWVPLTLDLRAVMPARGYRFQLRGKTGELLKDNPLKAGAGPRVQRWDALTLCPDYTRRLDLKSRLPHLLGRVILGRADYLRLLQLLWLPASALVGRNPVSTAVFFLASLIPLTILQEELPMPDTCSSGPSFQGHEDQSRVIDGSLDQTEDILRLVELGNGD
ncbi:hypothetical protein NDU88_005680 [Pleurodeles waltl]|uniref:Uncharacterized protein n=1 Tax=Pleurodeles waltl TaxID=8319 RepID=A0AAV7LD53_PLEWA|nr:hypothetical protein NDU88_005680 [Pleurodeles waltl]